MGLEPQLGFFTGIVNGRLTVPAPPLQRDDVIGQVAGFVHHCDVWCPPGADLVMTNNHNCRSWCRLCGQPHWLARATVTY